MFRIIALCCVCFLTQFVTASEAIVWSADTDAFNNPNTTYCQAVMVREGGGKALKITFQGEDWGHLLFSWNDWHEGGPKAIAADAKTSVILRLKTLPGTSWGRLKFLCAGTKNKDSERRFLPLAKFGKPSEKNYVDIELPLIEMSKTGDITGLGTPVHAAFFGKHGKVNGGILLKHIRIKQP